ncbi:TPA: fluoride efflux transporter CrcB [Pseudomonas aeruginosa]|nr:fluoride efflux transporter CrcB [Pseudomonas aeruginosa]
MGFILVFIGSGIGGMARHGVGLLALKWFGPNFPIGTLTINIVGSGLMGLVIGMFALLDIRSGQNLRLLLTTGVIGGFTTFSTFSLDAVVLWERGEHMLAVGYVTASVLLSMVALVAMMLLMRRLP